MRNSILFGLARLAPAAILAGTAVAADLPSAKEPLAPPPPVFSWQGLYAGVYAGALLGDGSLSFFGNTPLRGAAFVGGGTVGYNWQWSEKVVLGLEADFGYRGSLQVERQWSVTPSPTDAGVLGTARARLGYAFTPRWLVYGTAGFAYGTDFISQRINALFPVTFGQLSTGPTLRAGWTAGGGLEYAWSDQISLKAEYLYTWLADSGVAYNTTLGPISANLRSAGHIVRGGLNYHFSTAAAAPPVLTK